MARVLSLLVFTLMFTQIVRARDLGSYPLATLRLGAHTIKTYVADTDERREKGLMYIESLPVDTGMLFIFEAERPQSFWMKNTMIPLAIGFFNGRGVLVDKQEMNVASSMLAQPPIYRSAKPAQFALEMSRGWLDKHGIKVGASLKRVNATGSELADQLLPAQR